VSLKLRSIKTHFLYLMSFISGAYSGGSLSEPKLTFPGQP
jgi:hypothetical protein